jgi:hypothetical protein
MKKITYIPFEKRNHLDFEVWEKEALKDPLLKAEYDRQQPEFAAIQAIIDARVKRTCKTNGNDSISHFEVGSGER